MPLGGVYTTGTASFAFGSATVNGTGVLWNDVVEGDHILMGGQIAMVDSVNGGFNQITLKAPWTGVVTAVGPTALTSISNGAPAVFTSPTAHGLLKNDTVTLTTTGTLPSGLTTATTYFVIPITTTTFQLSATVNGTAINTTTAGSGTHSFTRTGSAYIISKMSWLRYDPSITQTKVRDLLSILTQDSRLKVVAQFDKITSTTLSDVTDLIANVIAGKTYRFRAVLFTASNVAAGVKASIGGNAVAASISYEAFVVSANTLLAQTRATALGTAVAAVTAVTVGLIIIEGTIVVSASGTLTVQFAQNASNAAASSVLLNSSFDVELS
jgi:hypothetical protein